MSATVGWRDGTLWGGSLVAAVAVHAALGLYLVSRSPAPAEIGQPLEAVMVDMAPPSAAPGEPDTKPPSEAIPEAAAPEPVAHPMPEVPEPMVEPPPPEEVRLETPPDVTAPSIPVAELTLLPPPVVAESPIAIPPPPKPAEPPRKVVEKPKPPEKKKVVQKKPLPQQATRRDERRQETRAPSEAAGAQTTASLAQASSGASAASAASWRSQLVSYLQRNLRYPPGSSGGGAATVSFSMARSGRVLSANLARSAGSQELDQAALALFRGTLPPPPPEVPGQTFTFTIPIRFSMR